MLEPSGGSTASQEHIIFDNVRMGQFVDIEIQNHLRDRFKSYLIGAKEHQYIILEQPDSKRYGFIRDQLVDGIPLVLRTICEKTTGECLAFRSVLQGLTNHPHRLFYVSFPDEIQLRELRREQRIFYRKPAQIYMNKESSRMVGVITDISAGGCRFEFEVGESVRGIKQEYVYIELEHPETSTLQEVYAKVCSQRKEHNTVSIGLAFEPILQIAS